MRAGGGGRAQRHPHRGDERERSTPAHPWCAATVGLQYRRPHANLPGRFGAGGVRRRAGRYARRALPVQPRRPKTSPGVRDSPGRPWVVIIGRTLDRCSVRPMRTGPDALILPGQVAAVPPRRFRGPSVAIAWTVAAALPLVGFGSLVLHSRLDPDWTDHRLHF